MTPAKMTVAIDTKPKITARFVVVAFTSAIEQPDDERAERRGHRLRAKGTDPSEVDRLGPAPGSIRNRRCC